MTVNVTYREPGAVVPASTTVKNSPLSNAEIDGNFKSVKDAVEILETQVSDPTLDYKKITDAVDVTGAKEIQRRRGTTLDHVAFTGAQGEITVDTDKKVVVVHDGVTPGGFPLVSAKDLAAPSGSSLVGYQPAGTGAVATTVENKLREIINIKENGATGNGVTNDGASVRSIFAKAAAGSTVLLKSGTYLLDKDLANNYCLLIDKVLHLIIEPGVVFKAATDNLRAVIKITAPITHSGVLCVDADYRANFGVEATAGARGLTLLGWEAKKVTQQFNPALACAPFVIYSEVGVSLIECKANNAIAYANGTIGDTPGASRGVYIFGAATEFGVNRVIRCQIDTIVNTNSVAGNYEDEDGIESSMTGGYTIVRDNVITNCMKRGIKMMSAGEVIDNIILTSRNHASDYEKGMWAGVSIYSSNVKAYGNKVLSLNVLFGEAPGRVYYGIEIGAIGVAIDSVDCFSNEIELGKNANSKYFEGIHINGALTRGKIRDNRIKTHADSAMEGTYGIRLELDHPTHRSNITLAGNDCTHFVNAISIRGGFSGDVFSNSVHNVTGIGIVVYDSTYALKPRNINFSGNTGDGFDNYLVRVADALTTGITASGNMSEAASFPAFSVVGTLKYTETGSVGIGRSAEMYGSAAPTAGTYSRGDRVANIDPRDTSPVIEWQCQYGGTPGTWRPSHWMVLKNTTANRPPLTTSDVGVTYLDTSLAANGKLITWGGFSWLDANGSAV